MVELEQRQNVETFWKFHYLKRQVDDLHIPRHFFLAEFFYNFFVNDETLFLSMICFFIRVADDSIVHETEQKIIR
jgi:hypothetical protein